LQIRLRQIFTELSGEDFSRTPWGVDGCSIPNYTMTLPGLARALSAFILDPSWGKAHGLSLSEERKARLKQINDAILAEPHYLAGTGAFGTDFIQTLKGKVILKGGAEGVYVGILPKTGQAFAVKVSDGAGRAAEAATAALLRELGAINDQEWVRLSEHTEPKIRDRNGQIVGKISVAL
jgi:L-asparaginase II